MTMDKSAIEQIQNTTGQAAAVEKINESLKNFATPLLCVPTGYDIKDVEKYADTPSHFRGQFSTEHINSFVTYVSQHKQSDTAVFVCPQNMRAKAEITLGTNVSPKHRLHSAALTLEKTEAYTALLSASNVNTRDFKPISHKQEDFAFWLQDWADCIVCSDQDIVTNIDLKDAIKAVRQLQVDASVSTNSTIQHFAAQKSTLEKIGVFSEHALPAYIKFTCNPYKDLKPREFLLRMQIIRITEGVRITLKPVAFEIQTEKMAEEFELLLSGDMAHLSVPFFIGKFQ